MRAEFCIFKSNAPGLKANFYELYVDMPTSNATRWNIGSSCVAGESFQKMLKPLELFFSSDSDDSGITIHSMASPYFSRIQCQYMSGYCEIQNKVLLNPIPTGGGGAYCAPPPPPVHFLKYFKSYGLETFWQFQWPSKTKIYFWTASTHPWLP